MIFESDFRLMSFDKYSLLSVNKDSIGCKNFAGS